jgi:hypothetical protein
VINMAINREHLRQVSRTLYGTCTKSTKAAVGAAVPAGKRRYIHYAKVWHNGTSADGTPNTVSLYRDGATGAVGLDILPLPGSGIQATSNGDFRDIGAPGIEQSLNIDTPIYILESAETLGIGVDAGSGPDNAYILVNYYDEP